MDRDSHRDRRSSLAPPAIDQKTFWTQQRDTRNTSESREGPQAAHSPPQKNRESRQAALQHSAQQSPPDRIAYAHNNALTHDSSLHQHSCIATNPRAGPREVLDQPLDHADNAHNEQ